MLLKELASVGCVDRVRNQITESVSDTMVLSKTKGGLKMSY